MRRYGDSPKAGQSYTFRPGVYVILPRAGKLLLTHQSTPYPEFQLPGGGVDPGEHPLTALHREVFEETGWRIAEARRLGAFRRFTWMPEYEIWAEKLCVIYTARPVFALGDPTEPGHSAHWVPTDVAAQVLGNPGERDLVTRHIL